MNQMIRYSEMPPIDHTGQFVASELPASGGMPTTQRPVQMAHVATNTPNAPLPSAGPKRRGPKVGSRRGGGRAGAARGRGADVGWLPNQSAGTAMTAPVQPAADPYAFHSEAPNGITPHSAARQLFQTAPTTTTTTGRQNLQHQQHEHEHEQQQSHTNHLREASRLTTEAPISRQEAAAAAATAGSQQVRARMLAHPHKAAGPQTQMSLPPGGAMQQPVRATGQAPPMGAASVSNARLSNPSEPPVSYYSQQHQEQATQNHHYRVGEPQAHEMHAAPMIARRTGQPHGQVVYGPQANAATTLTYQQHPQQQHHHHQTMQPATGYSNASDMAPVPQGARLARQQSPYLQQQQQQQQQPIPVRHNQQQLINEPPTMQQQQHHHQRGYARPAPNQPHANFNPSVNTTTSQAQAQQVQQPHQQPLMSGPSGDLMAPTSGDSFAQSSAPLLQQQLNRQRPNNTSQLAHEPAHYQLDGSIQAPHQQQHANFAYQQQQQLHQGARPMASHKQQRPMQAGLQRAAQQQRQQVNASVQLQQQLDVQPQQFPCNPTPPLTPNRLAGGAPPNQQQQQLQPQNQDDWSLGYPQHQQQQPVNGLAGYHQEAQPAPPSHQQVNKQRIQQMPKSHHHHHHPPTAQPGQFIAQPHEPQVAPVVGHKASPGAPMNGEPPQLQQIRLTLPLRDGALVGPFKLEHDVQFATKSFHLRPQLFEQLSKAAMQQHHQTAAVIQELQFRAYLSAEAAVVPANMNQVAGGGGNSLLAANQQRPAHTNSCQWPEMFQVSCNQQLVHLDRSSTPGSGSGPSGARLAHRAVDLFPYCQPGDNSLELQVHGCYCSHEYVLELVDRPTLKAFMNSCFKTRLLSSEACLSKLGSWFGKPGFSCQLPAAGIINEYVTEYLIQPNGQQVEQTRLKISLRCPLSGRRMRTPTRGPNCTHLQCFDLESFLFANRERTRWSCPICALPVPFNMLELDQHQIGICQTMASVTRTDEVLVNNLGQWQSYQAGSPPPPGSLPPQAQQPVYQHQSSVKANGTTTFHPQQLGAMPMRPARGAVGPPAHWDQQQQQLQSASPPTGAPVRRPPASVGPPHQSVSKAKRSLNSSNSNSTPPYQSSALPVPTQSVVAPQHQAATNFLESPMSQSQAPEAELSPLAAMERTIIHHEQQMGPPPFDANILTASSSPLRSSAQTPSGANAHSSPSSSANNVGPSFASPHHQPSPPDSIQLVSQQQQQQQAVASPLRQVAASPQHQSSRLPQSPLQQTASQVQQSSSTPATPATPLLHAAPETPATPGQPCNLPPQSAVQQQQQLGQQQQQNVDHQPLSNGSASAASITSTSTLTPSGQSLGSVGMGGDSRCNTAPLQNALGSLDDLVQVPNSSGQLMSSSSSPYNNTNNKQQMAPMQQQLQHQQFDPSLGHSANAFETHHSDQADKSDILMSKLMMEAASESGQTNELALALEEAEWKHQLDRGKSEHLANFLNEPLMNKKPLHHHHHHHHQQQHQNHFVGSASHHLIDNSNELDGVNKMLSANLNATDDEALNQLSPGRAFGAMGSPTSELLAEQLDQQHQHPLDSYANYLDSNAGDDGAGLPPDDSILDLFER